MSQEWKDAFLSVLAGLAVTGPRRLMPRVELAAEGTGLDVSIAALLAHLSVAGPNDVVRKAFSVQLAQWDAADDSEDWTRGSAKQSEARRALIYRELGLDSDCQSDFSMIFPINTTSHIVIAEDFEPWYTRDRQSGLGFYWPTYRDYLMAKPGWAATSVSELDTATTDIVQRLSDPSREEVYQSKGLVVGYVQSGKTANIAGVLAKSIDAGYRLLIVLTGTIDLLREQTQRRLDMELVGVENIRIVAELPDSGQDSEFDYSDDPDWDKFVCHGARPSTLYQPDIVRLTSHRFGKKSGDYQSLRAGITALEIQKLDQSLPLHDRTNLDRAAARLAIVKKNANVLKRLVRDLKRIPSNLAEIPALIIDDESDLASVNTRNPSKWKSDQRQRTAINSLISEILSLLPRAQYIGYTATPFANVFVDPSDSADIFPKDFLIALSRPSGYMGASDFHDLEPRFDDEGKIIRSEGEITHVRDLVADRDDEAGRLDELGKALSMFVLTGAIKLWRQSQGLASFRHHTMLAHESVRRADHMRLADSVRSVWRTSGFASPSGLNKLQHLYEWDIVPNSARYEEGQLPEHFDDLRVHIGEAIARITATEDPVLVVNSDKDIANEDIDFDKRPVWRVLVGGAKLSRGFTVEGLTVSYYRRKTGQADSLMQMGRWFGFRTGYRDLVRLYIDRQVRSGRRVYDLYEAFGASVRAEELFRNELLRYSKLIDGKPQVRPIEIPPLVTQHLPWLRPTASNKMYNAELEVRRFDELEPVAYPTDQQDLDANYDTMLPLLLEASTQVRFSTPEAFGSSTFDARVGLVTHNMLVSAIKQLRWLYPGYFDPNIAFLSELSGEVDDWAVIVPQLQSKGIHELPGGRRISVSERRRSVRGEGTLFQGISDPKHRHAAQRIAQARIDSDDDYVDPEADGWSAEKRGALIIYPITELEMEELEAPVEVSRKDCIMAMRLVAPGSSIERSVPYVGFRVQIEELKDDPIVDDPRSSTT